MVLMALSQDISRLQSPHLTSSILQTTTDQDQISIVEVFLDPY